MADLQTCSTRGVPFKPGASHALKKRQDQIERSRIRKIHAEKVAEERREREIRMCYRQHRVPQERSAVIKHAQKKPVLQSEGACLCAQPDCTKGCGSPEKAARAGLTWYGPRPDSGLRYMQADEFLAELEAWQPGSVPALQRRKEVLKRVIKDGTNLVRVELDHSMKFAPKSMTANRAAGF